MYSALIVTPDFTKFNSFDDNLSNIKSNGGFEKFSGFDFMDFKGTQRNVSLQVPLGYRGSDFTGAYVKTGLTDSSFLSLARNLYQKSKTASGIKYLSSQDCIREYSPNFLAGKRNLLVVVNNSVPLPAVQATSMVRY